MGYCWRSKSVSVSRKTFIYLPPEKIDYSVPHVIDTVCKFLHGSLPPYSTIPINTYSTWGSPIQSIPTISKDSQLTSPNSRVYMVASLNRLSTVPISENSGRNYAPLHYARSLFRCKPYYTFFFLQFPVSSRYKFFCTRFQYSAH